MTIDSGDSNRGRVCVVGCGHVGATSAYALLMRGVAREVVLVDADPRRAEGEAMDLRQAAALARPVEVRAGDWSDAAGASVVVVAAGGGRNFTPALSKIPHTLSARGARRHRRAAKSGFEI